MWCPRLNVLNAESDQQHEFLPVHYHDEPSKEKSQPRWQEFGSWRRMSLKCLRIGAIAGLGGNSEADTKNMYLTMNSYCFTWLCSRRRCISIPTRTQRHRHEQ